MFKRTILFFMAVFIVATTALAQITITSANFPAAGTVRTNNSFGAATFSVGSSGANQSWTFADQSWDDITTDTYVNPASTPYTAQFPTATHCVSSSDTASGYAYFRVESGGFYALGFAGTAEGIPIVAVFNPRVLFAPLPMTYPHANWTSVARYTMDFGGGITMTSTDSMVHSIDAWGTVNTPFGNHSALREFHHDWYTLSSPFGSNSSENVGYTWYNQNVMDVVSLESDDGVTSPNFNSGTISMTHTGSSAVEEPVRGPVASLFTVSQNYPNPFNPTTRLPITLEKAGQVALDIYDETGRLVSHQVQDVQAGRSELAIDGAQWASGMYIARVTANSMQQAMRMQLIK